MSNYKCSKCGMESKVKGNVNRHIENKCPGAELIEELVKLQCDVCNKEYCTDKALKIHKATCFKKKAVVVNNFIDAEEVKELIKKQGILITSLSNSVEYLMEENKELKQRIEKLEFGKKVADDNKKKGYEEIEEECEDTCSLKLIKTFMPKNFDECDIKFEKFGHKNKNVDGWEGLVLINGKIEGAKIMEKGIKLKNNDKVLKYGDISVIYSRQNCLEDPMYRIIKTGECYCKKHFDTETGVPIN